MQDTKLESPFLRTPFNYDRNLASDQHGLNCEDPSLAKQEFKDECNINTIVERFGLTGELPQVVNPPTYGDYTGIYDFQSAMNVIRTAQESFMELPAHVRAEFDNDPQKLLQSIEERDKGENRAKLERLGILDKLPAAEPPADLETSHGTSTTTGTGRTATPPAQTGPGHSGTQQSQAANPSNKGT